MLLSLDPNQDLTYLKWQALQTKDQKLSHGAAHKVKEIFLDNQRQFADQLGSISWLQVFFVLFIFTVFYFVNKKYRLNTPINKITVITSNILERITALFGYFVPLVMLYASYIEFLLPTYPYLNLIIPKFMWAAMNIYKMNSTYISYGYFFGIIFLCLQLKVPRPRFIRFHMIRGLMLVAFLGVPDSILRLLQFSQSITTNQRATTILCIFVLNLFWILPCLFQAVTYTYPKSSFIRDAIEIMLGRDDDENFKWWDRK